MPDLAALVIHGMQFAPFAKGANTPTLALQPQAV